MESIMNRPENELVYLKTSELYQNDRRPGKK